MEVGYLTVWLVKTYYCSVTSLFKVYFNKIKQPVDVSALLLLATVIHTFQKEEQLTWLQMETDASSSMVKPSGLCPAPPPPPTAQT